LVQLDVVDERGPAMQREVQRIVQVVIKIRARADDEVNQPTLHHLDDAAAETGGGQGSGNRQPHRRVVFGQKHLVGEDPTGFAKARRVERLKSLVNQRAYVSASAWTVVTNRLARQILLTGSTRGTGGTVRHKPE